AGAVPELGERQLLDRRLQDDAALGQVDDDLALARAQEDRVHLRGIVNLRSNRARRLVVDGREAVDVARVDGGLRHHVILGIALDYALAVEADILAVELLHGSSSGLGPAFSLISAADVERRYTLTTG